MRRAVFLDRDGVLNETLVDANGVPHPPRDAAEVAIVKGAPEVCKRLRDSGYLLVLVTNQPDVARGTAREETVHEMNELIRRELELDDVRMCVHDGPDGCACRKPRPGLLLDAARDWGIDLGASVMIGDRWVDVAAGQEAGCKTVLIERGYSEAGRVEPTFVTDTLVAAANWILQDERRVDKPQRIS